MYTLGECVANCPLNAAPWYAETCCTLLSAFQGPSCDLQHATTVSFEKTSFRTSQDYPWQHCFQQHHNACPQNCPVAYVMVVVITEQKQSKPWVQSVCCRLAGLHICQPPHSGIDSCAVHGQHVGSTRTQWPWLLLHAPMPKDLYLKTEFIIV